MRISVAIVDDKYVNRLAHKHKLSQDNDIHIVYEYESGEDFLARINENAADIDVVLMDIEMKNLNGIETIFRSRFIAPHIKFIVVTVFEDNSKIFEAIKAGAHGYLLKEDSTTDIADAIRQVYEYGAVPMSPAIARKAMQLMIGEETTSVDDGDFGKLSDREKDVLRGLIAGKNYKTIADELFISPFTVRRHVSNIYEKLYVNCRAQIILLSVNKHWK
jgi:DNA-binding NarL/FixJ family response regulator